MTWTVVIITILVSLLKILATCLPTGVVEWLLDKFATHSKLNGTATTITFNGKVVEGQTKSKLINEFNEAILREKHYVFPGNEELFLFPEESGTPLVIHTKKGQMDVALYVYEYDDHIYVAKKYKKKVVAYSLFSDNLSHLSGFKTNIFNQSLV